MMREESSQLLIVILIVATLVVFIFLNKKITENRKRRQKKIDEAVERIKLANKPGYRPPDRFDTYIQDGVISYKKKRDQSRKK
jgi:hypothetical protein